jgi:hypothetical protein
LEEKQNNKPRTLKLYRQIVEEYPNSPYANQAKTRLAELEKTRQISSCPSPTEIDIILSKFASTKTVRWDYEGYFQFQKILGGQRETSARQEFATPPLSKDR